MAFYFSKNNHVHLTKTDFIIGTAIALGLFTGFYFKSSGFSLIATFIPGLIFSWILFAIIYFKKLALPEINDLLPIYFAALAWQFIHFSEEFITGFNEAFPAIYGGSAYDENTFVVFNMMAYCIFLAAPLFIYFNNRKFLFLPVLFFVVYGTLGNAVSHSWWCIYSGKCFPGFYTSLPYFVLAPILLHQIVKSKKQTAIFIIAVVVALIFMLSVLITNQNG